VRNDRPVALLAIVAVVLGISVVFTVLLLTGRAPERVDISMRNLTSESIIVDVQGARRLRIGAFQEELIEATGIASVRTVRILDAEGRVMFEGSIDTTDITRMSVAVQSDGEGGVEIAVDEFQ
jgi:hypothetical protein